MTENLTKLPVKSILRKSSLTFIEHDDSEIQISLDMEKPTKVIVEPIETPPKEYPGETEEEKARREDFELKRKMNRHQEAMKVAIAKKLLSQEENIEEELDANTEDDASVASEDALESTRGEDDNDYYYASADDITEDDIDQQTNSNV
ncbi:uncharacterized protein [Parasteatoda tepidariorum]|uniref:uncharacterized protein n=1 Tax=Parasteatoda tepidariorum TaxID=114398 RepID=UPI00077F9692|nr:uncharacterized protein LOC107454197 [Parasteatoda tepidariorum]